MTTPLDPTLIGDLFAARDELARSMAVIDRQLEQCRRDYMVAERVWGIGMEQFRREIERAC